MLKIRAIGKLLHGMAEFALQRLVVVMLDILSVGKMSPCVKVGVGFVCDNTIEFDVPRTSRQFADLTFA